MALLIECREGAFFCSSFQAENDQISANQDWAIIFQVPLPSHAKVLSKYNNRVQISPAGFSPYLGWRWRICIIYLFFHPEWRVWKAVIENETKDLWLCSWLLEVYIIMQTMPKLYTHTLTKLEVLVHCSVGCWAGTHPHLQPQVSRLCLS